MTKREYNQQYYLKHREALRVDTAKYRADHREVIAAKAMVDYYKNRDKILAQKREYTQRTREHKRIYNRHYAMTNKNALAASGRQYRKNNKEKLREVNRAYWLKNKAKHAAWMKASRQRHPETSRVQEHRRRALLRNAKTDFVGARQFFSWIKNQDFVTCTYCGKYISGRSVSIDHIVPLSRGGTHEPDHFCVSCRSCNSSKHDQLLTEWKRCPERIRKLASFVETSQN